MSTDCVFCAIAAGRQKAELVYDQPDCLAFLDHRPVFPGHCLLIPRRHVDTLADLPGPLIQPLFETAQLLSRAVEQAMQAEGTFVAINNRVSQSVPHLHVHVVPRRRKDGLKGFFWPRHPYPDADALLRARAAIRSAIERLRTGS